MAFKMLDGNGAAVEAIKMAKVQVVSAYPITPQSTIAEKLSELVASGELKAEYVRVESEHTALSVATTAQLAGVRAATATASQGLALMHEVAGMTSGCRVPIVMPVVNRGLAAPWTLWADHGDAMAERDTGWLQFYCQNVQEVFDLTVMAYRIAEDAEVLTPAMKTLSSIANGYDDNLISRTAGVMIKEGRKLILCPRETPLSLIHLENMVKLSRIGVKMVPPMPAFYNKPESIDDIISHHVMKVLDQFGIKYDKAKRWN